MDLETHLKDTPDDLAELILTVAECSKKIRDAFMGKQGMTDTKNIYGERQVALDKWADQLLVKRLGDDLDTVKTVASEEQQNILVYKDEDEPYNVTLDPVDGSSLIGVNLTVGTIVGIFKHHDVLSQGRKLEAAMYVLYGPLNILVYTVGKGVHEFAMNKRGKYFLQRENIRIPDGKIYAPGALRRDYLPVHKKYIEMLEEDGYKLRYSGSFVADVHQLLCNGGIFTYPGFKGRESGKLRLLFEANPIGFIVTKAGGAASTGLGNILDVNPSSVADRVPIYIGGKKEIELIERLNRESS